MLIQFFSLLFQLPHMLCERNGLLDSFFWVRKWWNCVDWLLTFQRLIGDCHQWSTKMLLSLSHHCNVIATIIGIITRLLSSIIKCNVGIINIIVRNNVKTKINNKIWLSLNHFFMRSASSSLSSNKYATNKE